MNILRQAKGLIFLDRVSLVCLLITASISISMREGVRIFVFASLEKIDT